MGDWIYYATFFSFRDVDQWIKPTTEVHKNRRLSDWIQRGLDERRPGDIADYLVNQDERFFNALVVGVYGGAPEWNSLKIAPQDTPRGPAISKPHADALSRSVGFLSLDGRERLFAIDGQHRVAGIKAALGADDSLADEEVCVIFVAHQTSANGRERTRRLFTTLNKTAVRVSDRDLIALDEDNAFAILTRRLVDQCDFLRQGQTVAMNPGAALNPEDRGSLTSIVNLYKVAMDLHPIRSDHAGKRELQRRRPSQAVIDELYTDHHSYWAQLKKRVPEYRRVLVAKTHQPADYRQIRKNHLLFRPIGQRAFAAATRVLLSRDFSLTDAIRKLLEADLWIHKKRWHHILWDPVNRRMITDAQARSLAETHLLREIKEPARNPKRAEAYEQFLRSRTES